MYDTAIGILGIIFFVAFIIAMALAQYLPDNRQKPDPPNMSKWNK